MASSGQIGFPLGGSRFTPTDLRAGPGVGGPRDAAAAVASDWLLPAVDEHPIDAAFIDSTAAAYGPSVGAAVAAAAIGSGATVPAPAIGAGIVAGFVASSAVVYAPTVESGAEPEPEPSYGRYRPAPQPPPKKRKPKPKKKPAPLFVERPAVVILPPLVPVGAEWADPVADEEAAVVAALYALNAW